MNGEDNKKYSKKNEVKTQNWRKEKRKGETT